MVPTNATITSGQYSLDTAKAAPVAIISRHALRSIERRWYLCATRPIQNVSSAEPSSVLVMIEPIATVPKPSSSR